MYSDSTAPRLSSVTVITPAGIRGWRGEDLLHQLLPQSLICLNLDLMAIRCSRLVRLDVIPIGHYDGGSHKDGNSSDHGPHWATPCESPFTG
jgi:hypothetical protein